MFSEALTSELNNLNTVVDGIVSESVSVNDGVLEFGSILHNTAFKIFGTRKRLINTYKRPARKYISPWYNRECELARHELKLAYKQYKRHNSQENHQEIINKRKLYNKMKRKAKAQYQETQKTHLNETANKQPNKFWEAVKKFKNKTKKASNISIDDFYDHFKGLFSTPDEFEHDRVSAADDDDLGDISIAELDDDITLEEVHKAIGSLKRGKSPGIDDLVGEIFIECKHIISPLLCKVFNHIYTNSAYPESWTKSILVPKKGDANIVDNYRGIMLSSVLTKLFSTILDTRLRNWSETNNLITDYQFGFRQNRSTTDCIFILQSIIHKILNKEKKRLYCAFVDFKKAFDLVYRNGIWYKLLQTHVSTKFVRMLKSMYTNVKICIKANGEVSDFFDSYTGVKQGETLSPLLFIMFINDMYSSMNGDNVDIFTLNDVQIFMLLFADDTVLFSYSIEGLQILLNKLHDYCTEWNITVNTKKTVAMLCKKGPGIEQLNLFYNNEKLDVVNKFTYLGVTMTSNGTFFQTQNRLSEQALKAIFSLNSLFDKLPLKISEKMKLFQSMIIPIFNYGSEIWGFHKGPDIEKVHLKFLKQLLYVRKQTPNAAVYGELGQLPLCILRKERILKYWYKIVTSGDTLINRIYLDQVACNIQGSWANNIKSLLDDLGYSFLWNDVHVTKLQLSKMIETLHDQYYQEWYGILNVSSKLKYYSTFKTIACEEKYLNIVKPEKHRICLTRLRCSSHSLAIEEGRFRCIDRNDRKCIFCSMNTVEDEYHFVLVCPFYRDIRVRCLPRYYSHYRLYINLDHYCQIPKIVL